MVSLPVLDDEQHAKQDKLECRAFVQVLAMRQLQNRITEESLRLRSVKGKKRKPQDHKASSAADCTRAPVQL